MAYSDWDFKEKNVEFGDFDADKVISAESTMIAAGRPTLAPTGTRWSTPVKLFDVYPMGVIENFGITMGNQLQRIFEIGSAKSLIIPGRLVGTATLARLMYDKRTLMRVMYAAYNVKITGRADDNLSTADAGTTQSTMESGALGDVTTISPPGYDHFFLNMDTDLLRYPIGLAVYFKHKDKTDAGAIYLENCYLGGLQLTINAGTDLLAEGANVQFTEMKPIDLLASSQ
jgi:hypothetical protein